MQGPVPLASTDQGNGGINRERILRRMRILVLLEDVWHSADAPRAGLRKLGRSGFEFDWIADANDWCAGRMSEYVAVILAKADSTSAVDGTPWLSGPVQQSFLDYVHNGNGLLVLHAGAAVHAESGILCDLIGGRFLGHPEQCPVTVEPHGSHALAAGCERFEIMDEHYFMQRDDKNTDVFMTTASEHGTQPAGWTRRKGEGRVCVLTPGHESDVWLHPAYQRLLLNALHWVGSAGD